ncbi:MAG: hypothetical protein U0736_10840 [Gemmataceae bacterium]
MPGVASLFREIHRVRVFLRDLQEQLDRIPRQRKAYQAKIASREQALKDEQEAIRKLKVTASDKEKQMKGKGDQIARWQQQQTQVSSKREYDALVLEIAHTREACGRLEDEILTAILEADERTAKVPGLEKAVADARAELQKFEADVAPRSSTMKAELEKATAQLKALDAQIPPDHRAQYARTVTSLGADGLAEVRNRICTNCHTEIIRGVEMTLQADGFAVCKSCGRILYLPPTATDDSE